MFEPGSRLETLALAAGYARAGMYDESEQVLKDLEGDQPTPDGLAKIHIQRGVNSYAIGDLDDSRGHFQLALQSDRLPISTRGWVRYRLMLIDFEHGAYGMAAANGELSRQDYMTDDCTDKSDGALAGLDFELAKYLSHADRDRALQYALNAVALAPEGALSAADLAWVELLRTGPAPAAIPPVQRQQRPAAPVTRAEALRLVSWMTRYRELIRKPPSRSSIATPADDALVWVTRKVTPTPPAADLPDMRMRKPVLPTPLLSEPASTPSTTQ